MKVARFVLKIVALSLTTAALRLPWQNRGR